MENQLVWQDRFNIGVDFIDKEHKKLFSIMNRLFSYKKQEGKSQWVCQEGIKYFKGHAMKHFTEEEAYMASIDYSGFETHRRLHDNFRKVTLPSLERELEREEYSEDAISHFLGVCAGWLIGHTLIEDHAITGKSVSKWRNLLPEDEQSALSQVIVNLVYDLFQLNSKVISRSYGGEKFGDGIYYRLVYATQKGENWEIVLAFEKKLLVSTVGSILGAKSDSMDDMLMNAVRYTARQFVESIRKHFSSADLYEMKEENLLSYEQLQKIFDREHPQSSLLFDTGAGYFAFCVMARHLLDQGIGNAIQEDNAMKEVKKYVKKSEKSTKKKILVVDDSLVVQQSMKDLLGTDYEISVAQSGLAAIRCITLDRPHLVLLDYEMPVCNGSQVLEMIRAEHDFADIPVIFLTGRADSESVKKVLSLKPAGYLIKSLKPEDIKKNIDNFFKG